LSIPPIKQQYQSNFRYLEQLFQITPTFSTTLIKLRGTLFSTVPINIDDKNLTKKNRKQEIFRANMNLLRLRFWLVWNGPKILNYCGTWSDSQTDGIWRVKIKRERRGL